MKTESDRSNVLAKWRGEQLAIRHGVELQLLEARRLLQTTALAAPQPSPDLAAFFDEPAAPPPDDDAAPSENSGRAINGVLGVVDHRRLVADLLHMEPHFRSGRAPAPLAVLTQLGGDILYARRNDHGAWRVRRSGRLHDFLASFTYGHAFGKALRVSWLHLALILGRRDLHSKFVRAHRMDLDEAVRWLVLYGMEEHKLWRFLDLRFLRELRARNIETKVGAASPLDLILLLERADLREIGADFSARMESWLIANGVHEYKLFWALRDMDFARMAGAVRPDLKPAQSGFAATLRSAREAGRIDVFAAHAGEVAARLAPLSKLSPQEREGAARPPIDYSQPEDDGRPATLAPAPITRAPFHVVDFLPGDEGANFPVFGVLGRPTAEGVPLASLNTVFFFAAPKARRVIVIFDVVPESGTLALLVRVNGEAADIFPAASLGRPARTHVELPEGTEALTVELECIVKGDNASVSGVRAWLRSIGVFQVML